MQDLSLGIQRGEVFGLLGPNGAGKTSAINMMIGFLQPSAGPSLPSFGDVLCRASVPLSGTLRKR